MVRTKSGTHCTRGATLNADSRSQRSRCNACHSTCMLQEARKPAAHCAAGLSCLCCLLLRLLLSTVFLQPQQSGQWWRQHHLHQQDHPAL